MGRDCGFCKIAYAYLLSRAKHLENGSKAGQNLNMNRKSPDLKLRRSVLCVPASTTGSQLRSILQTGSRSFAKGRAATTDSRIVRSD